MLSESVRAYLFPLSCSSFSTPPLDRSREGLSTIDWLVVLIDEQFMVAPALRSLLPSALLPKHTGRVVFGV